MIPGGIVATYGLRACPLRCAGRCQKATAKADGSVIPSPACELMGGVAPRPGTMPALDNHGPDQLRAMAASGRDADPGMQQAARAELRRRGLEG